VARLLAGGAAVDQARDEGATTLFMAAQYGHDAVVARLLAAGAGAGAALTGDGVSALMVAGHFGHARCVRLLLDGGADAAVTATGANGVLGSQAGDDALAVARRAGHAEIEALLRASK
jgi:ankyrin repeat protein